MAITLTLTPYLNLRAFRLGESIVFSNLSSLKCYFTQTGDNVTVEVSLCSYFNYEFLPNSQDLAVIDFPNTYIKFNEDVCYDAMLIHNISCAHIETEQFLPDEAYIVIDISNFIPKRNDATLPAQSQATLEEIEFIKRVIGEKRSDIEYQIIDLNLILSGLENYIQDNLIIPITN